MVGIDLDDARVVETAQRQQLALGGVRLLWRKHLHSQLSPLAPVIDVIDRGEPPFAQLGLELETLWVGEQ
jgi:hypothetical protein